MRQVGYLLELILNVLHRNKTALPPQASPVKIQKCVLIPCHNSAVTLLTDVMPCHNTL